MQRSFKGKRKVGGASEKAGASGGDALRMQRGVCMGRDKNTFEKHRREMAKKQKAKEKRERRLKKKEQPEREPVEGDDQTGREE